MERFHSNGLSYYCNQKVENLSDGEGNLHCRLCSKNLVDFRHKSKQEYESILLTNTSVCGVFCSTQIGDEKEIILNWKRPFLIFSVLGTIFFTRNVQAHSFKKPPQELKDTAKSIADVPVEHKSEKSSCEKKSNKHHERMVRRATRRRLYTTKSFPYIRYGRMKMMLGYI